MRLTAEEILVDDREKNELDFSHTPVLKVRRERLETGDYTTPDLRGYAAIERKSIDDLATCVGTDRERFESQIQRGSELEYFEVHIDVPRHLIQEYADESAKSCPHYYSNVYPASITGTVDAWEERYDVSFRWFPDADYMALSVYNKLNSWENELEP